MNHVFDQIVLFGDSITQCARANDSQSADYLADCFSQFGFDPNGGWGAALANDYQRRVDVMNRGYSGYNTDWALPILQQLLPLAASRSPATILLLVIFFGANDAALPPSPQHVPLARYRSNLRALLALTSDPASPYYSPETRLLLITPPPLNEQAWAEKCRLEGKETDRKREVTEGYARVVREVGAEVGVPVVDAWAEILREAGERVETERKTTVMEKNSGLDVEIFKNRKCKVENERGLSEFLNDGLHLTPEGNRVLHKAVLAQIRVHYPELDPATMPMALPWWREIDYTNYKHSLQFSPLKRGK
ncbi:SGNH hydrolase-type esterase domain-containing protein [Endogone sp. FLAS-F59071]|nr:SGNH hydrolase-type esterase domain-containing protein [Endogone sp. FLAS-F59071]|eukprot:RUS16630.1 SGNH hydrolase-type esterase domain-containing protein [Endogone sp. FLAS-F59071]